MSQSESPHASLSLRAAPQPRHPREASRSSDTSWQGGTSLSLYLKHLLNRFASEKNILTGGYPWKPEPTKSCPRSRQLFGRGMRQRNEEGAHATKLTALPESYIIFAVSNRGGGGSNNFVSTTTWGLASISLASLLIISVSMSRAPLLIISVSARGEVWTP